MLKDLMSMMEKKMAAKGKMDPMRQRAKLEMLGALKDKMDDHLGEEVKGMKMSQVTVAAPDKEKLAKGLDVAKDVVGEMPEKEMGEEDESGEMEESEEEEGKSPAEAQVKMALDGCEDIEQLDKMAQLIADKKKEVEMLKLKG